MVEGWNEAVEPLRVRVEAELSRILDEIEAHPRLREAMRYAVVGGGKRMRPVLAAAVGQALGGEVAAAVRLGCAVEFIHAYSLVHDDLPSMDNDLLRRGMPTVHVQFGEAMAILVGDALQAAAFEVVADATSGLAAEGRIAAVTALARAAGAAGMVGGQVRDIGAETGSLEALMQLHAEKTGALFEVSARFGGLASGWTGAQLEGVAAWGALLGRAFQVGDDVEDALEVGQAGGAHEALVNVALMAGPDVALQLVAADLDACRATMAQWPGDLTAARCVVEWVAARAARAAEALANRR
jgi:geranylgeranyl diphosphate synthase type II